MSTCISNHGEFSSHNYSNPAYPLTCDLCGVFDEDAATKRIAALEATCDELATAVVLLAHDAHPVYGNTAGWRGGIGGQAITQGCAIIDPPPGFDWTQCDLPTEPAREWFRERDVDLEAIKARLRDRWTAMLRPATHPDTQHGQEASER